MPNKRYVQGRNFEYACLAKAKQKFNLIKGARYYASRGICDIWWVDKYGKFNEAQCKHSHKSTVPISNAERERLKAYADKMRGISTVYLAYKLKGKPARFVLQ